MTEKTLAATFTPLNDLDADLARKAYACLDLTSLTGQETDEDIIALAGKATHPALGHVAALCVYPKHIPLLNEIFKLDNIPSQIATVINFPYGDRPNGVPAGAPYDVDRLVEQTRSAIIHAMDDGADEIDIVFPYTLLQAGDAESCRRILKAASEACDSVHRHPAQLKVILETAAFDDLDLLRKACEISLECGADYLKTSTGKHPGGGATHEKVAVLLDALEAHLPTEKLLGLKVSGGVSTFESAKAYMQQVTDRDGAMYITPRHFRLGSSGLGDDILKKMGLTPAVTGGDAFKPTAY